MKSDAGKRRASPEANGDIKAVIRSCETASQRSVRNDVERGVMQGYIAV
jgi:hypothetical protein